MNSSWEVRNVHNRRSFSVLTVTLNLSGSCFSSLRQENCLEFEASLEDIVTCRLTYVTVTDPVSSKRNQNLNINHFESLWKTVDLAEAYKLKQYEKLV